MSVEKLWDELWIGVKCQSNTEIAGSPRNSFRASLVVSLLEVELLDGRWARWVTDVSQTPNAIRCSVAVRLPVTNRRKVGMTSNHHAPYDLGYTRATMVGTTSCESVTAS